MTFNFRHLCLYIFPLLFLFLSVGCRSSQGKSKNKKHAPVTVTIQKKKLKGEEKKLVDEAMSWIGTPYKYASSVKGKGTDCSGMVLEVYLEVKGIKLPRNSKKQAEFCKKIRKESVRPGDLVFFATGKDPKTISHVGMMIDENQFVHSSTKKGVIISDVTTDYYTRTFIMYGRVPEQ